MTISRTRRTTLPDNRRAYTDDKEPLFLGCHSPRRRLGAAHRVGAWPERRLPVLNDAGGQWRPNVPRCLAVRSPRANAAMPATKYAAETSSIGR